MKLLSDWPPFLERTWNWCILHFSLRKIILVFSSSVIPLAFLYQLGFVYPEISSNHPYSDALIYENLANGNTEFFGNTHITHRILVPLLISGLASVFPLPTVWLFAFFHLTLLLFVFYRIAQVKDGLTFAFVAFLTLILPSFWRGFFLPMSDSALWAFLTLFWLEADKRKSNLYLLFLFALVAFFTKEIALFALPMLFVSALHNKAKAIITFTLAGLIWVFTDLYFSPSISSNYVYSPQLWTFDWLYNAYEEWLYLPKYLISGLAGILVVWLFRVYTGGLTATKYIAADVALFLVIFFFAASNSPRIIFPFTGIILLRMTMR